jgi:hypothetical protein
MTSVPHSSGMSGMPKTPTASSAASHRWRSFPPQPKSVRIWEVRPAGPEDQARQARDGLGWFRSRSFRLLLLPLVLLGVAACIAALGGWLPFPNHLSE